MNWNKISGLHILCVISMLFQGCALYSFSGTALSKEVKTFSVQDFQNQSALGPADLAQQVTEKLCGELLQNTPLKQVDSNGDIQFEGMITDFKYMPIAPSSAAQGDVASRTQLTITLEVTYTNNQDQEFAFSKKKFSQSADMDASASIIAEEPSLVEEVLTKLVKDILNASIANW